MSDDERSDGERLAYRISIAEATLWAAENAAELLAVVAPTKTNSEARARLMAPPYGFTEIQAHHVLDLLIRNLTGEGLDHHRKHLEQLRRGDLSTYTWNST